MLEVYLDPCTVNSRKVLAGLDLLGTEFHFNHTDYFAGAHKDPEYLKINPHATVPAAVDGDCKITESNAILQYAADLGSTDQYYPKDLKKRANVNRWLLWEGSVWFQSCYIYLVEYVVKPLLKTEPDESIIAKEAPRWNQLATILDNQLGQTRWLTGERVTIADLAVAAPMHLHKAQRLPLDKYPNLTRWLGQVEALPCWQKTQGAVDKALLPDAPKQTFLPLSEPNSTNGTNGTGSSVRATFNYTKDVPEETEIYFYETGTGKENHVHAPGDDPHEVSVHNGRGQESSFTVDKNGFSLHAFKTPYQEWEDEARMKTDFYPDVVDFLTKTVGAKRVLVFDHTIRTAANQTKKITDEKATSQRAPVMLVHCDYTAQSGPVRVKQLLPDEADELLKGRVAFFNVWKPIRTKVEERPLAMCDARSTSEEDFFKLFLRYRDRTGENYVMKYKEGQKWWYFPGMTTDEVILLKVFDSKGEGEDGYARWVGHSAFEDPNTREGAPMRESVEIRTIAFF